MLGVLILGISTAISAQPLFDSDVEPIAGKDFKLLDNIASGSAQIDLYCWLGSSSCYTFETALREWASRHKITVRYIPLIKRPDWRRLAKAIYVAQQMAIESELSALINQTLHEDTTLIESDQALFELAESIGLSSSRFANLFYAAETNLAVNQIQIQAASNGVRGVPTIIVNNLWLIDASMHQTSRQMLNATAHLLGVDKP